VDKATVGDEVEGEGAPPNNDGAGASATADAAGGRAVGGIPSRVLGALLAHSPDILIVGGLLALFSVVHRRVEVVEFGGDAVAKWQFARQWAYQFDWKHADLDHHCGRMGVNALARLSQLLFGRGWKVYYVAPFFAAMLQIPFVYAIGKRVMNRLAGMLAVLFITYLATVHRSASQMLPDGFAGTYAAIATYFYLRFLDGNDRDRRPFLVAMAASAFVGYLAKETFVFFYPGMVVAVWMARRNLRDVVTFLGVLLGALLVETALYATFTKYSSRYAVVRSVHGADGIWQQVKFTQLFDRFAKLHDGWKYLLFFTFASGLWLLVLNVHKREAGRALAVIGFSQVFVLTFLVRRFDPIELWESFEPRYMEQFTPFAALISGAFLAHVVISLWGKRPWPQWVTAYGPTSPGFVAFWALGLFALVGWTGRTLGEPDKSPNAFVLGRRLATQANDTYRRNLPVITHKRDKPKNLVVLYDVYMDDALLVKDGKLPNMTEVSRYERGYTYVVKSPAAYPRGKFSQMLEAGCVLEVSRSRAGYELSSWDPLPASCDNLLRETVQ
jgi:Dolichyl-phosphate-mannose-protein mannosyltransferase